MSNQEVIRFHVPVDEVVVVQELQSLDHLVRDHQRRLNREFTLAKIEGVFQTWTQEVHDHGVVVSFDTKPVDCWDSS